MLSALFKDPLCYSFLACTTLLREYQTHAEQVQVRDNDPFSSKDIPSSSEDRSSSLKSDDTSQDVSSSSSKHDVPDSTKAVPLGLGLGSLDHKVW
jgi:hypothetical protein